MEAITKLEGCLKLLRETSELLDKTMDEMGTLKLKANRDVLERVNPETNKPLYTNETMREVALRETLLENPHYDELKIILKRLKNDKQELEDAAEILRYRIKIHIAEAIASARGLI